jgi:hypothetical protein
MVAGSGTLEGRERIAEPPVAFTLTLLNRRLFARSHTKTRV